jgi:phospholipid/cholesterol/gamma-HCH transport system ATP-binding protein
VIEIRNIKKKFGDHEVLKGVSATFENGKCNLIIGKSGSGKTVTLKCMVGLLEPDEGYILFDNRNITEMDFIERKAVRKEIGMLFQGTALFDSMTVEQNVRFPLDMFTNKTMEEKNARVNFCLERVNLVNTNKKYPGELSGGMKKRVGIARAIVMNPRYLFCDEPNSGLDPKTAIVIDHLIQDITREFNITTIVNTHDMNSVMGIGDKVVFLHEGLKNWEGTNKDILKITGGELFDFIFASDFLKDLRMRAHY